MKNLKEKLRTKSFWVVLIGAVVMLLQVLGLKVNVPYVNEVVNAVCAVMIILGVMTGGDGTKTEDGGNKDESLNTESDLSDKENETKENK